MPLDDYLLPSDDFDIEAEAAKLPLLPRPTPFLMRPGRNDRHRRPLTPAERRLRDVRKNLRRAEQAIEKTERRIEQRQNQAAGMEPWSPFFRELEPETELRQARRRLAELEARRARWAAAVAAVEQALRDERKA